MNKGLLIFICVLAVTSVAFAIGGKEVGYEFEVEHIPIWGFKLGGLGIGKSKQYWKKLVPVLPLLPKKILPLELPKKKIAEEIGLGLGFGFL